MLNNPAYSRPLQALHTGEVACSHKGIDDLVPAGQQQDHLRSLLIQSGLLEPLDLHLRRFETWCGHHIGEMAFDESRDVMRLYARWSQGRHLRRHQQQDTLTAGVALAARQRTSVAISFVEWVGSLGLGLAEVGQGDLDHWLAEGTSTRRHVASFITWANASGQTIGLKMPPRQSGTRPVLSQNERLRLLRTYFHDPTVPIDVRIAGLFLLLFATPITRIVALTPNDFTDDRASWTPGSVAVPLPMRLQELVVEQFASPKLRGSAAHGLVVVWLFPGRIPGQHLTAQVIRERLHEHGLPKLGPGRNSAVAALVRELPAPVAGQVCGIGSEVAARWATDLGTDRGSYPHHRNKSGE